VEGILRLLNSGHTEPVNIGNPAELTIKQFADLIKELLNDKVEIVYRDLPVDDPKTRRPDISLAKQVLGWEPKVSLREGLSKTIPYFEKTLRAMGRL